MTNFLKRRYFVLFQLYGHTYILGHDVTYIVFIKELSMFVKHWSKVPARYSVGTTGLRGDEQGCDATRAVWIWLWFPGCGTFLLVFLKGGIFVYLCFYRSDIYSLWETQTLQKSVEVAFASSPTPRITLLSFCQVCRLMLQRLPRSNTHLGELLDLAVPQFLQMIIKQTISRIVGEINDLFM